MEANLLVFLAQVVLSTAHHLPPFSIPLYDDVFYRSQPPVSYGQSNVWTWSQRPTLLQALQESQERSCLMYGESMMAAKDQMQQEMKEKNKIVPRDSPSFIHQSLFRKHSPWAVKMSRQGYKIDHASTNLEQSLGLTSKKEMFDTFTLGTLVQTEFCNQSLIREVPTCDPNYRYRSSDGSCNNLLHPIAGATGTAFRRVAPPDYGDGVMSLRLDKAGNPLPSARLVSTTVNEHPSDVSGFLTGLHVMFGQFLDHDLTLTPLNKAEDGEAIPCCPDAADNHPECAPIAIPADDAFYSQFNQTCMEFVRSAPSPRCTFGTREQMNLQSAYIDGSQIYGTGELFETLRTKTDGLLKTQTTNEGEELLPGNTDPDDPCNTDDHMSEDQFCFTAGDERANEQILLSLMHTVWTRHHNRLAKALKQVHPSWSDEKLFQVTRKIVVAQLQHVTYNEYLPAVLGEDLLIYYGLEPGNYRKFYDSSINAAISNEFATVAFRFGHSQLITDIIKMDENLVVSSEELSSVFMNPFDLYRDGRVAESVRGQVWQCAFKLDSKFTDQVTRFLFKMNGNFGMDLVSLNVQRGRDHGIPSYTAVLASCGVTGISSFSDLSLLMNADKIAALQSVYTHVDDIDVYVGGLSERPAYGSKLGITFSCILLDQFYRLQRGDRFYYETYDQVLGFTNAQLSEIRKTTLATILVGVISDLDYVQLQPFRAISYRYNPLLHRSWYRHNDINLNYF